DQHLGDAYRRLLHVVVVLGVELEDIEQFLELPRGLLDHGRLLGGFEYADGLVAEAGGRETMDGAAHGPSQNGFAMNICLRNTGVNRGMPPSGRGFRPRGPGPGVNRPQTLGRYNIFDPVGT